MVSYVTFVCTHLSSLSSRADTHRDLHKNIGYRHICKGYISNILVQISFCLWCHTFLRVDDDKCVKTNVTQLTVSDLNNKSRIVEAISSFSAILWNLEKCAGLFIGQLCAMSALLFSTACIIHTILVGLVLHLKIIFSGQKKYRSANVFWCQKNIECM